MKFALGYAINANELLKDFPVDKLEMDSKLCKELTGMSSRKEAVEKVFKASIPLILDDIINNSDTFSLPTRSKKAEIYIKGFDDKDFVKGRQKGKWKDVDYLASNFTGYLMIFSYLRGGYLVEKPIYLDKKHKDKITERTNAGKSYY